MQNIDEVAEVVRRAVARCRREVPGDLIAGSIKGCSQSGISSMCVNPFSLAYSASGAAMSR